MTATPPTSPTSAGWRAPLCLMLLLAMAAGAVIALRFDVGRPGDDQNSFYLPTIRQFSAQMPRPDFTDYPAAMTPGYFVALAAVDHWISHDVRLLRATGGLFGIALVGLLAAALSRRFAWPVAVVLSLPLAASPYVFAATAWILPDNAGWIGVLLAVLAALHLRTPLHLALATVVLLLYLVLVRQVHIWTFAPLAASAWIGADNSNGLLPSTDRPIARRFRDLLPVALAAIPAVLVLWWFVRLWNGLVPWSFQPENTARPATHLAVSGSNPATPAILLTVVALMAPFFIAYIPRPTPSRLKWASLAAVVALVLAVAPVSTYSWLQGRATGIWNVMAKLPTVADRSPVLWILAPVGAAFLTIWITGLPRRTAWIFAATWLGFVAAQSTGKLAWQRYFDPLILMLLPLMAAATNPSPPRRLGWIGPLSLGLIQMFLTVLTLR